MVSLQRCIIRFVAGGVGTAALLVHGSAGAQGVVDFRVSNSSGRTLTDVPVVFAHPFKAGDVKDGIEVASGGVALVSQYDVKCRHGDGSVQHAVVAFRIPSLDAGATSRFSLRAGAAAVNASPAVTRTQVLSSDFDATVTIGKGGETYRVSARDLLESRQSPEVWLTGPVVVEYLLSGVPATSGGKKDDALSVHFQVRFFSATHAWVSVVVENTWVHYRKNTQYDVTVTLGKPSAGKVLERANVEHYFDARWRRTFWWGGNHGSADVGLDLGYLIQTEAVPMYDRAVKVDYLPPAGDTSLMGNGTLTPYMPTTGGREDIGPYPGWAARYLLSFDRKHREETFRNGQQAGAFPIHVRDSSTNRIYSIDAHPTASLFYASGRWSAEADKIVQPEGSTPYTPDDSHQPSVAYVPYLTSGEYFFLEELYFWANYNMLNLNFQYRGLDSCLFRSGQVRGQAWSLRTLADAAYIAPDGSWEKSYFVDKLRRNVEWYDANMVGSNGFGWWGKQSNRASDGGRPDPDVDGDVRYYTSPWQSDFLILAFDRVVRAHEPGARRSRDWLLGFLIGRFTNAPDYNPYDGVPYHLATIDTAGKEYSTWKLVWEKSFALRQTPAPTSLWQSTDCSHGYPHIARAALSLGVKDSLAKARQAFDFVDANTSRACQSSIPSWAIVPSLNHVPADTVIEPPASDPSTYFSKVGDLSARQKGTSFMVQWSLVGSSAMDAVSKFEIYVSDNFGAYTLWKETDSTSSLFSGVKGHTYRFYSVVVDTAGKREPAPAVPDALTSTAGGTDIAVSPNPFMPSQGHRTITFFGDQLPFASIRIFNKAYELVRVLEEKKGEGRLEWDVRSSDGRDLASGVYIWVARKKAGKPTQSKFSIVR